MRYGRSLFNPADRLDGDSLLTTINHTLSKCNIEYNMHIVQCYDAATVLTGWNNDRRDFESRSHKLLIVHCHAHRLNLVLVDCVSSVEPAGDFFQTVQMLHHFFLAPSYTPTQHFS